MGLVTTFQPGSVLYAANLNNAYANTVNVAGDALTGTLTAPNITANNQLIAGTIIANTSLTIGNNPIFTNTQIMNVGSVSDLRNINTSSFATNTFTAIVGGYRTIGDLGGGIFDWNNVSSNTDDGFLTVKPTNASTGRWIRRIDNNLVLLEQGGAFGDALTVAHDDSTVCQNVVNALKNYCGGGTVSLTPNKWYYLNTKGLTIPSGVTIEGAYPGIAVNGQIANELFNGGGFILNPNTATITTSFNSVLRNTKILRQGLTSLANGSVVSQDVAKWNADAVRTRTTSQSNAGATIVNVVSTTNIQNNMLVWGDGIGSGTVVSNIDASNNNITLNQAKFGITLSNSYVRFGNSVAILIDRNQSGVKLENLGIVGFNTGIIAFPGQFFVDSLHMDNITNFEGINAGDEAHITKVECVQWYGPDSFGTPRPGDSFFYHEGGVTYITEDVFTIGWNVGFHIHRSQGVNILNCDVEGQSANACIGYWLENAIDTTFAVCTSSANYIGWKIQDCAYVNLISPRSVGGGVNTANATAWTPNTSYTVGQHVYNKTYYYSPASANGQPFSNGTSLLFYNIGNIYHCTGNGISANATNAPSQIGPVGINGTITDGTATWLALGNQGVTFLDKLIIEGCLPTDALPTLINGNTAAYTANISGFLVNQNTNITVLGSSIVRDMIILESKVPYNPTPNADGVIAEVQRWGNTGSVGVVVGNGAQLEKCLIIGFNTGVICNAGSKAIRDLKIDCYNGMEYFRIGDTGLTHNVTLEPMFGPITGWTDQGSHTYPNGYRPGIGFNVHDRCDGYEFDKLFAFNYTTGFKISNVWAVQIRNFATDNGIINIDPTKTATSVLVTNAASYIGLINPNFVGPQTYYLYNTACDPYDSNQLNPLFVNGGSSHGSSTVPTAGIYCHGGFWGGSNYLGPGSRTTFDNIVINASVTNNGFQIDDNIRYASIKNVTLLQGSGGPIINANNVLVQSGKLTVDNLHHTDGVYGSRLTRLIPQKTIFSEDPTLLDSINDPNQPSSVHNLNSQKRLDSSLPNRTLGIMRNWAEVGYIDATNQGMVLDTNNTILCVTGVSVNTGGQGYKVGNIVPLSGGSLASPGQNAAILVTSVGANGNITGATLVLAGAYTSFSPNVANTLGIVSGLTITNGGVNYGNNQNKIVILGDGNGAAFFPFINANGSIYSTSNSSSGYGILNSGFGYGYTQANATIYPLVNIGNNQTSGANATFTCNIANGATFNVILGNPNTLTLNPSGNTVVANNLIAQGNTYIQKYPVNPQTTTTTYVLATSDSGTIITFNNTSPTTVTIGNNLFVGFTTEILNINTGSITLSNAANTKIISKTNPAITTLGQNTMVSILCYAANSYLIYGYN